MYEEFEYPQTLLSWKGPEIKGLTDTVGWMLYNLWILVHTSYIFSWNEKMTWQSRVNACKWWLGGFSEQRREEIRAGKVSRQLGIE